MYQTIVAAQRAFVLAVQTVQCSFHKVDHRLVWRFAAHARNLLARFPFLAAPQINEDHQHPRFDDVWIDGQGLNKRRFRALEVFGSPQALENAIDVARAQAVVRQPKRVVEFDRAIEMLDGRVAIAFGHGAKDKARKPIAAAQKFFVSFGVHRRRLR